MLSASSALQASLDVCTQPLPAAPTVPTSCQGPGWDVRLHGDRGGVRGRAFPQFHHLLPPGSLHPNLRGLLVGLQGSPGRHLVSRERKRHHGPSPASPRSARAPRRLCGWGCRGPATLVTYRTRESLSVLAGLLQGWGNERKPLCCGSWAADGLGQVWRQRAHFAGSTCMSSRTSS